MWSCWKNITAPDKYVAGATQVGLASLLLVFDWKLGLLCLIPVVLAFAVI